MKLKKTDKQLCGLTLLGAALSLTIVFIILCFKKKSVPKAILAIAAVNSIAGAWLLVGKTPSLTLTFSPDDVELFDDDDEADEVVDAIRDTLSKNGSDSQPAHTGK